VTDNPFDAFDDDDDNLIITPPQSTGRNPFDAYDDEPSLPEPAKERVSPDAPRQGTWFKPLADEQSQRSARDGARYLTEAEKRDFGFETAEDPEEASFWGSLEHGAGTRNLDAYAGTLDHLADMSDDPSYAKSYRDWSASLRKSIAEDKSAYKPIYTSYKQVNGFSDAWGYVKEVAGEQIGIQLPGIVGAIAGGYLGQKAGAPMGRFGRAVGGFTGATTGALGGMIHHHVTEMRDALKREKIEGDDLTKFTNYGTAVLAGLDLAFPVVAGLKWSGVARQAVAQKVAQQLVKGGVMRTPAEFVKRFGKEIARDAVLLEVPTEIAQEAVTTFAPPEIAGRDVTDEEIQRFVTETVPETAIRTIIGAGPIAAPGAAMQARRDVSAAQQSLIAPPDQEQQVNRAAKQDLLEVAGQEAPAAPPETVAVEPAVVEGALPAEPSPAAPEATAAPAVAIGDRVNIVTETDRSIVTPEPVAIRDIIEDPDLGTYVMVEGSQTGIPIAQVEPVAPPVEAEASIAAEDQSIANIIRNISDQVSEEEITRIAQGDRMALARAIQQGLSDEQITQTRALVAEQTPEFIPQFDQLIQRSRSPDDAVIAERAEEFADDIALLTDRVAAEPEQAEGIIRQAGQDLAQKYGISLEPGSALSDAVSIVESTPPAAIPQALTDMIGTRLQDAGIDLPEALAQLAQPPATADPSFEQITQRRQFANLLNSRTPRSQWAESLGMTEEEIQPLIEEAIEKQWLRRDKNGTLKRAPKSQRGGNIATMAIADRVPDTLPNEGNVVLTPPALDNADALQGAVNRAAAKILPEAVRVNVVETIEVMRRRREDQLLAIRAFHGSPHDFDRFQMDRIGTGEGAQVFGHGLYFAENELVAKSYSDKLADYDNVVRWIGEEAPSAEQQNIINRLKGPDAKGEAMTIAKLRQEIRSSADEWRRFGKNELADQELKKLETVNSIEGKIEIGPAGTLYEVEIDVEPEQLLDWDAPLSEQAPAIQAAIERLPLDLSTQAAIRRGEKLDVDLLWRGVEARVQSPNAAAQAFREAGIPGIRYLDQGSRDTGDGTRNIVIFDDSLVKITKKNGKPVKGEERQQVIDQMFSLRAFHGSPHDFDRFQMDRIGTGEGAQAFGHGLYFAENEAVAGSYKSALANYYQTPEIAAKAYLDEYDTREEALKALKDHARGGFGLGPEEMRNLREAVRLVEDGVDVSDAPSPGTLYEVELDVEPEQLLDWDKPLSEQPEIARKLAQSNLEELRWFNAETQALLKILDDPRWRGWDEDRAWKHINDVFRSPGDEDVELKQYVADQLERHFTEGDIQIGPKGRDLLDILRIPRGQENASNILREAGISGIRYLDQGSRGTGDGTRNIVIFDDSLVKITKKNGKPVTGEERQDVIDQMYALRGFYSPAIRAAEQLNQKKGTGEQFWKQISKAPGVRKDELEWMGLETWLKDQKSVTRDEVLDFMRAHQVELDERVLGVGESSDVQTLAFERFSEDFSDGSESFNEWLYDAAHTESAREAYVAKHGDDAFADADPVEIIRETEGPAALSRYRHEAWAEFQNDYIEAAARNADQNAADEGVDATRFSAYKVPGGENYRELLIRLPELEGKFDSPHFRDQEIVHLRVDDRTGPDGGKVLFINEIQSDLHQKGRREGYQAPLTEAERQTLAAIDARLDEIGFTAEDVLNGTVQDQPYELRQEVMGLQYDKAAIEGKHRVPDAPFKGDLWLELALKRALLYAAENGYDAVSWARSDQIAKAVGGDPEALSVQYDQKIPRFLNKYTKKWGGEVEEADLNIKEQPRKAPTSHLMAERLGSVEAAREHIEANRAELGNERADELLAELDTLNLGANPILRITPEMRASVMEGQPMALRGGQPTPQILTPEFRNWFGDSKVVDEKGRPLRVYHATGADINEFQPGVDGGIHFGTAEQANMRSPARGNVVPVYLRAEKLKRTKDSEGNWKKTIARAKREGNEGIVYLNRYEGIPREEFQAAFDKGITQEQMDSMPDSRFRKMFPSARDSYIVFEPTQIKSAIGNRGTFDPTDPSIINAMRRGEPEALGQTDPYNMTISIAMKAIEAEAAAKGVTAEQEGVRVLRHEAVEFFKAIGLFTEKEWSALKSAARKQGWIETTGVRQAYEQAYQGMPEAELNDLLVKEAIAEQYSEFHLGRKEVKGKVGEVFRRIKGFIDRVGNFLKGEGFQTWDDVFTRIDEGEFKARFDEAFPELGAGPRTDTATMQATAGRIPDSPARRASAGTQQPAQSLAEVIDNFNRALGLTVRQGRLDPGTTRGAAAAGNQVRGQTSMATGVVRMRVPSEIDTLAHEGGHALEGRFQGALESVKRQHGAELTPLASPGPDALSEGFAEWFRRYVTNPPAAERVAPGFTEAFERFLAANDPAMQARLRDIQAGYQAWINAPSGGAVASSIATTVPPGSAREVLREFKQEGLRNTTQAWTDRIYTAVFDDLHPIRMTVDSLLGIAAKNLNISKEKLGLKTANNPYKLLRLARDGYSGGHMDLLYGVHDYQSIEPQGPSFREAVATAFGGLGKEQWSDAAIREFGAYLTSRRMVQEWRRFQDGEIAAPPDKFSLADHQQAIQDFEAKYSGFAQGAQQVYAFLDNMLRKKRDAGLITRELYDDLTQREDYVPVMRDMSDRGTVEGQAAARKDKFSIINRFRGSQRDVINPLESIAKDAYETSMIIARNDALKALDALARAAGPDGGRFAERIPAHEMKGTQVNVQEALRAAAKDAGVDLADMQIMMQAVDDQLGDNAVAQVWRAGDISEKGEAIVYLWEDGKRIPIRMADGKFGHDMLHAVTGMNRESTEWWVNILSLPSTVLRTGVTASADFIGANFLRDQVSAWVLTKDFVPFYDGARGIYSDLAMKDVSRIYSRVGGIMGGANVAAQHESRIKREVQQLRRKGIRITLNPFTRDFWRMTEFSETGTRLAVFERGFDRAKEDGLQDWEAAVEAAFIARDYIDFGRRGSRMLAARRLIPFFNAALQGIDRGVRGAFAKVEDNKALRTAITPYIKSRTGQPLSEVERRNKQKSAQVWGYMAALGMVGLGLSLLYKDDEEYEEISDYIKATHWLFRVDGEWVRIPKPFELAFFSNLVERTFDYAYKDDPTAIERFVDGLYEIVVPPHSIPGLAVTTELSADYNFFTGRPIVGPFLKTLPPELQFNAYASEFGKYLGKQIGVSPAYVDHFITGFAASWGREFVNASDQFMPAIGQATGGAFGLPTEPAADPAVQDYFFVRRFTTDPTRGSTSVRQFWDMMGMTNGTFTQAANGYRHLVDKVRDAKGAQEFLDRLPDEQRAYALLRAGNTHSRSKYRRLHPLNRAKEIVSVAGGMKKEINLNRLYEGKDGKAIELSPAKMRQVSDLLSDISMRETRNALIALKVRGWEQKTPIKVDTVYAELEAAAPKVHKEMVDRLKSKKLPSYDTVVKSWPVARDRILEDGQDAIITDLYRRDYSIGQGEGVYPQ